MKKVFLILFMMFMIAFSANAATLKGSVYDLNLDSLNNVIVKIDSSPEQQVIVKNGMYSFEVPLGEYTITAKYYEDNMLISQDEQNIQITQEGEFNYDLILFPALEEDEKLYEDVELDVSDIEYDGFLPWWGWSLIIAILFLFGLVVYLRILKRDANGVVEVIEENEEKTKKEIKLGKEEKKTATKVEVKPKKEEKEPDEYYDKVLTMLKNHKRMTQKEIRKEIPLSEAKISLIITEMEHKGIVQKIKKGRGNVIVLK